MADGLISPPGLTTQLLRKTQTAQGSSHSLLTDISLSNRKTRKVSIIVMEGGSSS